jgi:hypothetical protein
MSTILLLGEKFVCGNHAGRDGVRANHRQLEVTLRRCARRLETEKNQQDRAESHGTDVHQI